MKQYCIRYGRTVIEMSAYSALLGLCIAVSSINSAEAGWPTFIVKYEGKQYPVLHVTHGGTITNITASQRTILITLESSQNGEVQLRIQKELLNATGIAYGADGHVSGIFVDQQSSEDYSAVARENDIIFTIPFTVGTKEIAIVSSDIPEFSGIAPAILGISSALMVILSFKSR